MNPSRLRLLFLAALLAACESRAKPPAAKSPALSTSPNALPSTAATPPPPAKSAENLPTAAAPFRKLADSEVDVKARATAETLATRILDRWKSGKFEPFGDEATEAVRAQLTPDLQRQAWDSVRGTFGEYRSMAYAETWAPTDGTLLRIYRFRATFSAPAVAELRVVLDGSSRLAGIFVKPWKANVE